MRHKETMMSSLIFITTRKSSLAVMNFVMNVSIPCSIEIPTTRANHHQCWDKSCLPKQITIKTQLQHYQATLIKSLFLSCPIPHLVVLPADSEDLIFSTSSHSQACLLLYTVHRKKCACVQETVAFMKLEMLSVVALIM